MPPPPCRSQLWPKGGEAAFLDRSGVEGACMSLYDFRRRCYQTGALIAGEACTWAFSEHDDSAGCR